MASSIVDTFKSLVTTEKAANGNSGDPSKSLKQVNRDAEQTRSAKSDDLTTSNSKVTENSVTAPSTSVAQPPSEKESTTGGLEQNSNNPFTRDAYRHSDSPGITPSRELDESEDSVATISVRAQNGDDIISSYANFFLQAVSESEQEKYQVVETFTAFYSFFFGKRPPIYTFSGMLLNDPKQNWMNTFRHMYENYFRGTATADLNAQAVVTYDKRAVTGYILGLNIQQDAISNKGVPFSFTVLVIKHDLVGFSSDFDAFLQKEQQNLAILRQKAAEEIAALNKNPDGLKMLLKQQVLKGRKSAVSTKKTGAKETEKPPTNAKEQTEQVAKNAIKQTTVTPETLRTVITE